MSQQLYRDTQLNERCEAHVFNEGDHESPQILAMVRPGQYVVTYNSGETKVFDYDAFAKRFVKLGADEVNDS